MMMDNRNHGNQKCRKVRRQQISEECMVRDSRALFLNDKKGEANWKKRPAAATTRRSLF
jgi:hypothetical protein